MAKSRSYRRGRRHPYLTPRPAALDRLVRHPPADLSPRARARLAMLDWHRAHGENVSLTARHFGFSRPTVYRWLRRFERHRLVSLEDRSSVPLRRRGPTWTVTQVEAVARLREIYPRWGKAKLVVLLRRQGIRLSVSRVGRILASLRRRGVLREPARAISTRKRSWRRPYAIRKPKATRWSGRATSSSSTPSMCVPSRTPC
jgi:transposase